MIDERLTELLDDVEPPALEEEVRHAVLSGGKRVRPTITLYTSEALGGTADDALDYAAGVELVHAASLVVDDIVDRSDRRRDDQSVWKRFGHDSALTASDGLLGEAFALFIEEPQATQTVAEAMIELGAGEATELVAQPDSREGYEQLASRKTGALFRAAAELGALAAEASQSEVGAVGDYAERVGVAFQIRDDVLDATADAETLGKPTGQDAAMDRPSIVATTDLSPEGANDLARQESERALDALAAIDIEDEDAGNYLRELARYAATRER